ncbi:MAG: acyl-CoA desaturase [Bacteroidetes bacterium]|nr:acyl-CoA desaturase [Bacteroidota bacterium]
MKIRFRNSQKTTFYNTVRADVEQYFSENKISKQANAKMAFKIFLILSSFLALYISIVFLDIRLDVKLFMAIIFGIVTAMIGLNICHDAIHGSLSKKPWVNKIFATIFNIVGANAYVWHITHNIVHHTVTNIKGNDEDLDIAPGLIRIDDTEEYKPIHKYQHLYGFFLYGLASLSWVFRKDFVKFFKKNIGDYDNTKHPKYEVYNLIFFKLVYVTLFIVIPLVVMDITGWQFLTGFLLMHLAKGWTLALVFQPAHVVVDVSFPIPDAKGNIEEEWAIHQMLTTANFATKSKFVTWFTGGLNMQVEHHLFPTICHIHYPKISEFVKSAAKKHNIPYQENETFYKALKAHYLLLKRFSVKEQAEKSLNFQEVA